MFAIVGGTLLFVVAIVVAILVNEQEEREWKRDMKIIGEAD